MGLTQVQSHIPVSLVLAVVSNPACPSYPLCCSGEMTKMCPQVSDISFVATLKIRLGPMCDKIPGFGE